MIKWLSSRFSKRGHPKPLGAVCSHPTYPLGETEWSGVKPSPRRRLPRRIMQDKITEPTKLGQSSAETLTWPGPSL